MTIPAVVDQILRNQNIDYQVLDLVPGAAGPQPGGKVLSALLCDGNGGRLQVIHAADSLLDLNALNQLTGRDWRAVAPAEMAKLCAQHHLRQLPALYLYSGGRRDSAGQLVVEPTRLTTPEITSLSSAVLYYPLQLEIGEILGIAGGAAIDLSGRGLFGGRTGSGPCRPVDGRLPNRRRLLKSGLARPHLKRHRHGDDQSDRPGDDCTRYETHQPASVGLGS